MPRDIRLKLLATALHQRDRANVSDSEPWLYAVLARVGHPDACVGGHAIVSRAPHGKPGESDGFTFRTPFRWDRQYDGYVFELFGLTASSQTDVSTYPPEMVYPLTMDPGPELGRTELIVLTVRSARVMKRAVPIVGRGEWRPGWAKVEYSYVGVTPGAKGDTTGASEGLRLFANIPKRKTGPTAGTVKAAKYKTPRQWHAAIREKVLPRRTVATATDHQIAEDWLGISTRTMYRLMGHWGPSTLEDLRNGKSSCNCHSCTT